MLVRFVFRIDLAIFIFEFDLDGEVLEFMLVEKIANLLLSLKDFVAGGLAIHYEVGREDVAFAIEGPAVGVVA